MRESIQNFLSTLLNWFFTAGVKVVIALVFMFVSFKIINKISRVMIKKSEKNKVDKTVSKTVAYVTKIALKCLVTVCIIGYLGIDTSGITALIASLGVGIGLAVNGALSNLAGGVLILVTRPFRVDDFIEAQGITGTVADIHITNTKIITPDNKVIYVPNGTLANGNIVNYSEKETRRLDFDFPVSYSSDVEKAKSIIMSIVGSHDLVLEDPAPFVRVSSFGSSSIGIKVRIWTSNADYWTVNFDIIEAVREEFNKNGIEIPFDQLDVHIKQDK